MIEAILLAAGQSSRMGKDKALLSLNDDNVICHVLKKLLTIAGKVTIVLGDNFEIVRKVVLKAGFPNAKISFVLNENHRQGMFSSIRRGFSDVSGECPVILQMIDQPFITSDVYRLLVDNLDENNLIFQPCKLINGRKKSGHPILFAKEFKQIIYDHRDKTSLREIIKLFDDRRKFIVMDDESIFHNLNTPDEFKKIVKDSGNGNISI